MKQFKKRLLILATGEREENKGGSGFKNLVEASRQNILFADIVGVVSNHPRGGVWSKATKLNVPFHHFPGPWTAEEYQAVIAKFQPDFVALSGWIKMVRGLDPRTTINIHPGRLSKVPRLNFGGKGMFGHHVHEASLVAYKKGLIDSSAVTMHYVTDNYDEGPIIFEYPVPILENDTPDTLAARVNVAEHEMQPLITDLVVAGHIHWDGKNPKSLVLPVGYKYPAGGRTLYDLRTDEER